MPDIKEPELQPSLLNPAPVVPPVNPEDKLFPEPKKEEPTPAEPAKPEDPKPAEPEAKKEEPKEEPSKPSEPAKPAATDYESLKLPEGSLLSVEELATVKKAAKEQGLTIEEAQGVLAVKNDAVTSFKARQDADFAKAKEGWKASWNNDPDFGGDKVAESTELAKRAWDRLADNELKTWANQTGLDNYPPVLKMMARIGRMFAEDTMTRGAVGLAPQVKAPEDRLYGNTTPPDEPMK